MLLLGVPLLPLVPDTECTDPAVPFVVSSGDRMHVVGTCTFLGHDTGFLWAVVSFRFQQVHPRRGQKLNARLSEEEMSWS